jgi:LysR family transcriptional activator of dmlA
VVTDQGERVFHWAQRILDDMDQLLQEVAVTRRAAACCASPAASALAATWWRRRCRAWCASTGLQVRLEVFDRLVDVAAEGFDLDVRVGDEIAPHLIARRLADNHRVLRARLPGAPRHAAHPGRAARARLPGDQGARPPVRRLAPARGCAGAVAEGDGPLSANNGEMVVQWAVDGCGIALRSRWMCAAPACRAPGAAAARVASGGQCVGRLPTRLQLSAKVRVRGVSAGVLPAGMG